MESTTSSGEELFVKTRKPYTITKQREKWTEEEHGKFIDALKLYGRAWQRIEEHIGTKTAVQIRSHAQKFFTKLEKEALIKGIPFGQPHDIEIPPPRPKRKPSNPYPRNTGVGSLSSSVGAMDNKTSKSPCPLSVCKPPTEKENNAPRKTQGAEDNSEGGSQSEVLNLFQDAPSASVCSLSKGSSNSSAFKGFVPLVKGIREKISNDSSMFPDVSKELEGNDVSHRNHDTEEVKEIHIGSHTRSAQNRAEANASEKPEKVGIPMDHQQGDQSYSKHVPMEFIKGNSEKDIQMTVAGQAAPHTNAKPSFDPITPSTSDFYTNSGISSIHQSFSAFQPYTQLQGNHDAYRSFLNISNFSGLILSTCLQNPAVHAAACLAASFWPSAGADASLDLTSQTSVGGTPAGHMTSSPSMAAIAAATVAAASAWWATQGLLPAFPPLHPGFAFAPVPTTTINTVDTIQVPRARKEEEGGTLNYSNRVNQPVVEPEQSEALKAQCPSSKSFPSSSDSDQCVRNDLKVLTTDKLKPTADDGFHDSDKVTSKKKLDRSSCGSNTPSCSEVETDVLEKQNEDNDEAKQDHFNNLLSGDTNARRARSTGSVNESWKEVSEEGRIAFRALFTRGVLPQSFSPSHPSDSMVHTYQGEEVISELPVDLNMKACESETAVLPRVQEYGDTDGKGFSTSEIGHGKLKARRTGFKPYKRCSMEAKESLSPTGEEGGNKRIRLEGETSI